MKIVVFHSIYKPDYRGGAEVFVENLVQGLKMLNHEVLLVAVGRSNRQEEIEGIKVFRIKPFNLFNFLDINKQPAWKRFFWHIIDLINDWQTWKIFKILSQEKPELVITNNLKGLGYGIPYLIKILGIKHIHIVHDMQLIHPSGLYQDNQSLNWGEKIYMFFCKNLFASPFKVIFPSNYIKNIYNRLGFFKNSLKVVLNNPLPYNINIRKNKKSRNKQIVFVFVGQIEEYKGIIGLLKSFTGLPGNWKLLIAGEGKALDEAKKIALDFKQIIFYGHLNQNELEQKIWSQADILINPSLVAESFGMVVIEAYARGIPVLAADIGALSEIVKENQTGWLFKVGDWYDLRRRLEFIINNHQVINKLSNNCLKEAEKYSLINYLKELF